MTERNKRQRNLLLLVPVGLKEISVGWLVGVKERNHNKSDPPIDEGRVNQAKGTAFTRAKLRPSKFHQINDQIRNGCHNTVTQYGKDVYLMLLFHDLPLFPGAVRITSALPLSILACVQSSTSVSSGMATKNIPDSSTVRNMLIHDAGLGQDGLADAVLLAAAAELVD